ncbi:phosphocholine cytidylyltransferase family protein [Caldithrix abyssi]|uniref:1L-myo-inositol 1-phosphate cytidylyltransferase/CDP-L-myo-inositol myo-inositolphosphotransferase n=1 Tax=Caldithrix abyssi DSM 13497 TaxID=880073 RepID=H1XSM3_CALAY|nr:sugar phosphate nucleotidyltransferase [Caldithrix abyssi]APF18581.1 1L-myo-inositol 1-phosphate cytidylyltransferase/CDP-L-myo-inositol myo-inositolphosphotransferase [Caldithrix abyssi DSM 13497]EHO42571.1 4-diphosphocytidyl-2C-methyl-D-erythritolsynthas e [Caldithrix abyssi DSM 13497]
MKAVIVAAGRGSRLMNHKPKTLTEIGGKTIFQYILKNLTAAGVRQFVVVVGYQAPILQDFLVQHDYFGLDIQTVYNDEWQRGNGISVLKSESLVGNQPFILSMSDHIVSPAALQRIIEAEDSRNLLLVDPDVERIFDIDDATKVQLKNEVILDIGKELDAYNGIDCGIFRLKPDFYQAMRQQLQEGKESISAAIQKLINNNDMAAVFMQNDEWWIDIDTPESLAYAQKRIRDLTYQELSI